MSWLITIMPVVRLPDDVFRRLQQLAIPLVDTPATVIERLLDLHEGKKRPSTAPVGSQGGNNTTPPNAKYETYENRANPHVTIHMVGCSQLRKRGGIHRHGQGEYKAHDTLASAEKYAKQTGLPMRFCGFCNPR
jgi:hypothetical protein